MLKHVPEFDYTKITHTDESGISGYTENNFSHLSVGLPGKLPVSYALVNLADAYTSDTSFSVYHYLNHVSMIWDHINYTTNTLTGEATQNASFVANSLNELLYDAGNPDNAFFEIIANQYTSLMMQLYPLKSDVHLTGETEFRQIVKGHPDFRTWTKSATPARKLLERTFINALRDKNIPVDSDNYILLPGYVPLTGAIDTNAAISTSVELLRRRHL